MFKLLWCFILFSSTIYSTPIVTCTFTGELGNQMFQIAATVSYALDHGYKAEFPDFSTATNGFTNREFVFHRLNTLSKSSLGGIYRDYHTNAYVYTSIPSFNGEHVRLCGYFMNIAYFSHHTEEIRALLAPTEEITRQIQNKYPEYTELASRPTVAIHVRTFLPVGNDPTQYGFIGRKPQVGEYGGIGWEYFLKALEHFPDDYTFLVFSDCPEWTKSHFPSVTKNLIFIEGNPHYFDFYFMSMCDHQIVSPDSTFSWWAAWLNPKVHKKVIVPSTWQYGYAGDGIYRGAYPDDWIQIKAERKLVGFYSN